MRSVSPCRRLHQVARGQPQKLSFLASSPTEGTTSSPVTPAVPTPQLQDPQKLPKSAGDDLEITAEDVQDFNCVFDKDFIDKLIDAVPGRRRDLGRQVPTSLRFLGVDVDGSPALPVWTVEGVPGPVISNDFLEDRLGMGKLKDKKAAGWKDSRTYLLKTCWR